MGGFFEGRELLMTWKHRSVVLDHMQFTFFSTVFNSTQGWLLQELRQVNCLVSTKKPRLPKPTPSSTYSFMAVFSKLFDFRLFN